jgi:hypothetical protein
MCADTSEVTSDATVLFAWDANFERTTSSRAVQNVAVAKRSRGDA